MEELGQGSSNYKSSVRHFFFLQRNKYKLFLPSTANYFIVQTNTISYHFVPLYKPRVLVTKAKGEN